jgi:hypothetical protein
MNMAKQTTKMEDIRRGNHLATGEGEQAGERLLEDVLMVAMVAPLPPSPAIPCCGGVAVRAGVRVRVAMARWRGGVTAPYRVVIHVAVCASLQ